MQTPRCKGNMDSCFAMAWHFPRPTAPGPSPAGFPEGCQRPEKKSSMRVLGAYLLPHPIGRTVDGYVMEIL